MHIRYLQPICCIAAKAHLLLTRICVSIIQVVTQRLQAGVDKTWLGAVSSIVASRGLTGFYVGWVPALALRLPFTVILECILVVVFKVHPPKHCLIHLRAVPSTAASHLTLKWHGCVC